VESVADDAVAEFGDDGGLIVSDVSVEGQGRFCGKDKVENVRVWTAVVCESDVERKGRLFERSEVE
jgi:hypothetical protein